MDYSHNSGVKNCGSKKNYTPLDKEMERYYCPDDGFRDKIIQIATKVWNNTHN